MREEGQPGCLLAFVMPVFAVTVAGWRVAEPLTPSSARPGFAPSWMPSAETALGWIGTYAWIPLIACLILGFQQGRGGRYGALLFGGALCLVVQALVSLFRMADGGADSRAFAFALDSARSVAPAAAAWLVSRALIRRGRSHVGDGSLV